MHYGGCRNDQVASELQLGRPRLRPQKVAESRGGEHACLQAHHIHAWDNDIVSVGFQEPLQPALDLIGVADLALESERSEERRVGKEWVSKCRSRWVPFL